MSAAETPGVLIVCEGACTLQSGKPGFAFSYVDNDGVRGESFALSRKSKLFGSSPRCGVVYAVDMPTEGQFLGPAKYVKAWADEAEVLGWTAKHDMTLAAERELKRRATGENAARDKALLALDPIRRQYHNTDAMGRRLLIAAMIEYVQRNPAFDSTR